MSVPNKPVLPTAINGLIDYATDSMRRQTGQPLGRRQRQRQATTASHAD